MVARHRSAAPGGVAGSFIAAHNHGTPSELYVSQERDLNTAQYERIPRIDADRAKQIYFSLVGSEIWDASVIGKINKFRESLS